MKVTSRLREASLSVAKLEQDWTAVVGVAGLNPQWQLLCLARGWISMRARLQR
jgi:hypothetical protein